MEKKVFETYRPISLLNVDYKIIVIVMANRLKLNILQNIIISDAQTCCIIIEKYIANTIVSVETLLI